MKKKNKSNKVPAPERLEKESTPVSRMDDACGGGNATDQFLKRQAYHATYLADIEGSERIDRRIQEENS